MKVLAELVQEGKFDFIGISEAKAETLRRAVAVRLTFGVNEHESSNA